MSTHDFRRRSPSNLTWEQLKGLILQQFDERPPCQCEGCRRTRRVLQAVEREQVES